VAEPVESEINIPVSVGQEKAQPTRSSTSEPPVDDSRGANAAEAANTTPPPKPEDVSVLKNNSMDSLSAETSTNLHGASELDDPGQSAITESMRSPQVPDVTAVPLYHLIPKPAYPSRSRDLAEEGVVIIAVLVGKDGGVLEAYVSESSGYPLLDGSALTTVIRKWRFKPGMRRGTAVPSWVRVPIKFSILGS
jgi:protein TonB